MVFPWGACFLRKMNNLPGSHPGYKYSLVYGQTLPGLMQIMIYGGEWVVRVCHSGGCGWLYSAIIVIW